MTHTPEPWEILRHDLGDDEIFFVPVEILAGNGKLVVAYEGGLAPAAHEWTAEEIEANASLMVAAPDMLRTLESVLALINESFGVVGYHLLCGSFLHNGEVAKWEELGIREEVEAAIKKARGEE